MTSFNDACQRRQDDNLLRWVQPPSDSDLKMISFVGRFLNLQWQTPSAAPESSVRTQAGCRFPIAATRPVRGRPRLFTRQDPFPIGLEEEINYGKISWRQLRQGFGAIHLARI